MLKFVDSKAFSLVFVRPPVPSEGLPEEFRRPTEPSWTVLGCSEPFWGRLGLPRASPGACEAARWSPPGASSGSFDDSPSENVGLRAVGSYRAPRNLSQGESKSRLDLPTLISTS